MKNIIEIDVKLNDTGLSLFFNNNEFSTQYPQNVWSSVPKSVKNAFKDNLALIATMHLPMVLPGVSGIKFSTSRPILEPYLFQNFIFDIPSNTEVDGTNTDEVVRKFLTLDFIYKESDILYPGHYPVEDGYRALVSMSFGKDSLLTFALAEELGLDPKMIYIVEDSLKYEQKHKTLLGERFQKEFNKELSILIHETGKLRNYTFLGLPESEFGWGLQNTEYALSLIPFAYAFKGKYILFGNEQSTAATYFDEEGKWRIYPCYDQTHVWTSHIDQITQLFTGRTVRTGSLIEPLMDIFIQRILIRRYSQYADYQMSCFTSTEAGKEYRWCHECSVCAKMFLLSIAGGMDPKAIGLTHNMLSKQNKNLFTLFGGSSSLTYANTGLGRDEQLFNFYLAAKRGNNSPLVMEFKESKLYQEAKDRENELFNTFIKIYDSISVPKEYKNELMSIFREEINLFEM
ncbi:MAG: hypothetical protein EAX86_05145 [Candidatus Heimdallarchaeota archaeon]|nr:hypothetical protein [Candidatus Heimdallarchaeota archaeon]